MLRCDPNFSFLDPPLRQFDNKLVLRRHHREDLAVHLESAGAESFTFVASNLFILDKRIHNRRETRSYSVIVTTLLCLLGRLF